MRKRALSFLLALCMCVSLIPAGAASVADASDTESDSAELSGAESDSAELSDTETDSAELSGAESDSAELFAGEATSGYCGADADGKNLSWTLDGGTLTISGKGKMQDFAAEGAPWNGQRDSISSVFISDGVTSIGNHAFYRCPNLRNISIPDGVTTIGAWSMVGCALSSLFIPRSVSAISNYAFYGLKNLNGFSVDSANPAYVAVDGVIFAKDQKAIVAYPGGKKGAYQIPDGVTKIVGGAFGGCGNLTEISIPESVVTIDPYTFNDTGLTSVRIPSGVTSIGAYAFAGSKLTSVSIPSGVTTIGEGAFGSCKQLTGIAVDAANTAYVSVDGALFSKDKKTLFAFPAGKSGEYRVPAGVNVGRSAFYATGLTNVVFPDGVTEIKGWTFRYSSSLSAVYIPASVTAIAGDAFESCTSLQNVLYGGTEAQWKKVSGNGAIGAAAVHYNASPDAKAGTCGDNVRWTLSDGTLTISGAGKMSDWTNDNLPPWYESRENIKSVVVEKGVTHIGARAFQDTRVTGVSLPDGLTEIGACAFYRCADLRGVSIPDSVTVIGGWSFTGCKSLPGVRIPAKVTYVGDAAFYGCQKLTVFSVDSANAAYVSVDGVLFAKDRKTLMAYPAGRNGEYAIPDGVTTVRGGAFGLCAGLTGVTIPAGVASIETEAFEGCEALTGVTLPDSVTNIGDYAFQGSGLTEIAVPRNVSYIGKAAFGGCKKLSAVDVDEENAAYVSVNGVAFSKDKKTLVAFPAGKSGEYGIPMGVETVAGGAFYACAGLTRVTIPHGARVIETVAFRNCQSLTEINIPDSVTEIKSGAFQSCGGLKTVSYGGTEEQWKAVTVGDDNEPLAAASKRWNVKEGICGDNLRWALVDGVLTISGTGEMYDYGLENRPTWDENQIERVEIAEGVTSIGRMAFRSSPKLTEITIPDSVSAIGWISFVFCGRLTAIKVSGGNAHFTSVDGVLYNKDKTRLWYYPGGLTGSFEIPAGVTEIVEQAFDGCQLTEVTIPEGVTVIGTQAFGYSGNLTTVRIPLSVKQIASWTFGGCGKLSDIWYAGTEEQWKAVQISGDNNDPLFSATMHYNASPGGTCGDNLRWTLVDGVLEISGAGDMTDWKSVSEIPWYSMRDKIRALRVGNGVTSIGNMALYNCGALTGASLPAGLARIGNHAFWDCYDLSDIAIPDSVTSIGDYAFYGCEKLAMTALPAGLVRIGNYAFWEATGLRSVAVPRGLAEIGEGAFLHCAALTAFSVDSGNPVFTAINGVLFSKDGHTLVAYPAGKTGEYAIPDSVTEVRPLSMSACTGLTGIRVGDGNAAFAARDGVLFDKQRARLFTYPAGKPGAYAVPNGVTEIAYGAFWHCAGLTGVTIPAGVTGIKTYAFRDCTGLTGVAIPDSVTEIGAYAFRDCRNLASVTLSKNLSEIAYGAFWYSAISEVTIPDGVKKIDVDTFAQCMKLERVTIPASVTEIGDWAFYDTVLKDVYYGGAEAQWKAVTVGGNNEPLAAANVHFSEQKRVPGLAELTYSFANSASGLGYPKPYRIPYERYVTIFGDSMAAKWYFKISGDWGGNCYGFSSTAAMFSQDGNGVDAGAFRDGATLPAQLQTPDKNASLGLTAREFLEAMQVSQNAPLIQKDYQNNKNKLNELCAAVKAYQQTGTAPVMVAVFGREGGHALLAYKIEQNRLYVYDCNYPAAERYITLTSDASGNYTGWYYPISDAIKWGSAYAKSWISYVPYADFYSVWTNRNRKDNAKTELLTVNADVVLKDFNGVPIASLENGELITMQPDIFPLIEMGITADGQSPKKDTVSFWIPVGIYDLEKKDDYVRSQGEVVLMDAESPFKASVTHVEQSADVSTTSDRFSFVVDDESELNRVMFPAAAAKGTYDVTFQSTLTGQQQDARIVGSVSANALTFGMVGGQAVADAASLVSIDAYFVNGKPVGTDSVSSDDTTLVTFAPNGGGGSMSPRKVAGDGKFTFPECEFTAPSPNGKFTGWSLNGVLYQPGKTVDLDANAEAVAQWSGYGIADVAANGNAVTVKFVNPVSASVTVAACAYSDSGKLLSSAVKTVDSGASAELSLQTSGGAYLKAFLLDAKTAAPLCNPAQKKL